MSKYSCCIAIIVVIVVLIICFYSCNQRVRNKTDYCIDSDNFASCLFITQKQPMIDVEYPVIMKPAVKSSKGTDVELIKDVDGANAYIEKFDFRDDCIIVQEYIDGKFEASIMYINNRITGNKYIHEIVTKTRTDSGNVFKPAACRNDEFQCGSIANTSTVLEQQIINDMSNFPDMNVSKLDVIANSLEDLLDGKYKIIEINSRFGSAARAHNKSVFYAAEWFGTRVLFGAHNLVMGRGLSFENVFVDTPKYVVLYSRMVQKKISN